MFDLKTATIYNRPMSFQFRGCTLDQPFLLPPSLQEWLPDGHLARFIADGGAATLRAAPLWQVPTLLLYAGTDKLVSPRGSAAFAQAAPARVVMAHCFEGLYHEIFNELEREPVYARLQQWLDRWF